MQQTEAKSYDTRAWARGYTTLTEEQAYWITPSSGTIPEGLSGTLWRNGPGRFDRGGVPYTHPFDGDGMILAVTFKGDRVYVQNRYVATAEYQAEQRAGRILYKNVFGTLRPEGFWANWFDFGFKNVANTGVIHWGDKLLALWEAAPPYHLDPVTLATWGSEDLGALAGRPFSAHPRIDPVTGHLWNFGIQVGLTTQIHLYELDQKGVMVSQRTEIITGMAFIHDCLITENYVILVQNPMALDPLWFVLGVKGAAECLRFAQGQPTRIFLFPKAGGPKITLETDPFFIFHHVNAYEEQGSIVLDTIRYEEYLKTEEDKDFREVDFTKIPGGRLWRLRLDLATKKVTGQQWSTQICEFPQVAPQCVGYAHRYAYIGAAHDAQKNGPLQVLWKVDFQTQAQQRYSFAPHGFVGEPQFIPRPGSTSEDAGWIVILVYQSQDHHTDIVIFDAQNITAGPVTRIALPHHVPFGLHGNWSPGYHRALV